MRGEPTEMPQRQLAQELRFAIDDARRTGRVTQVQRLILENPRGALSSHVAYVLGTGRMGWLLLFAETAAQRRKLRASR